MSRFSRVGWLAFAALAMVMVVSQAALAQREQGRRGRGGPGGGFGGPPSMMRLSTMPEVETALKISDEQKEKIAKINDDVRSEARKAYDEGGDREKLQDIYAVAAVKLNEVLDEGQQKRLMGVYIQVNGANATIDPAVAKELNITDDQKKKLEEARDANREAMREVFEGARDQDEGASREEMRAKMEKLREEANGRLLAVLTDEQKEKLESLKGEKVEIDMSQLRGPGGGRGFGDRGRGEGGERNRDESSSESKSSS